MIKIKELLRPIFGSLISSEKTIIRNYKILTEIMYKERLSNINNDFAKKFAKNYFSQTDEDGITLEIIKRVINKNEPTFLEFGVGDGLENNSLVLLSLKWRGSWFGGEDLAFKYNNRTRLQFEKIWINKDNILDLYNSSLKYHGVSQHELVSIDLDGNDLYLVEKMLEAGACPKLFICEYNGIFPPGSKWKMKYDDSHLWDGDHYYGASLRSFVDLFSRYNYFLCACNPQTGTNAFFVRSEYRNSFTDIPDSIEDIYIHPCYWVDNKFKHKITPKFISSIIDQDI